MKNPNVKKPSMDKAVARMIAERVTSAVEIVLDGSPEVEDRINLRRIFCTCAVCKSLNKADGHTQEQAAELSTEVWAVIMKHDEPESLLGAGIAKIAEVACRSFVYTLTVGGPKNF